MHYHGERNMNSTYNAPVTYKTAIQPAEKTKDIVVNIHDTRNSNPYYAIPAMTKILHFVVIFFNNPVNIKKGWLLKK